MLDLRKIRLLVELERLGTIAEVARAQHVTAPGVSMQLAALEREVGVTLTERRGRLLALTPAGAVLARHGQDLLDRLALVELEVDALRGGSTGTYRMAAFPSSARTIVASLWHRLGSEPELGLRIELEELEPEAALPELARGDVDIALTHAYSSMATDAASSFAVTTLGAEPVYLAVRAGEEPRDASWPADLVDYADHDWILPGRAWACHEMVQRACGLAGFTPRGVAEATDFQVQLALVAAGAGVALVPALTIASLPPGVILRQLAHPISRTHFFVTRTSNRSDPGVERLRTLVAEVAEHVLGDVRQPTA